MIKKTLALALFFAFSATVSAEAVCLGCSRLEALESSVNTLLGAYTTGYIRNQDTLQAGTTIYVGSGTVVGTLTAGQFIGDGSHLTGTQGMAPGATYYLQNRNTLQSGATVYVTSGTVQTLNSDQAFLTAFNSYGVLGTGESRNGGVITASTGKFVISKFLANAADLDFLVCNATKPSAGGGDIGYANFKLRNNNNSNLARWDFYSDAAAFWDGESVAWLEFGIEPGVDSNNYAKFHQPVYFSTNVTMTQNLSVSGIMSSLYRLNLLGGTTLQIGDATVGYVQSSAAVSGQSWTWDDVDGGRFIWGTAGEGGGPVAGGGAGYKSYDKDNANPVAISSIARSAAFTRATAGTSEYIGIDVSSIATVENLLNTVLNATAPVSQTWSVPYLTANSTKSYGFPLQVNGYKNVPKSVYPTRTMIYIGTGTAYTALALRNESGAAGAYEFDLGIHSSSATLGLIPDSNFNTYSLGLQMNGVTRINLAPTGNVSFGTTSARGFVTIATDNVNIILAVSTGIASRNTFEIAKTSVTSQAPVTINSTMAVNNGPLVLGAIYGKPTTPPSSAILFSSNVAGTTETFTCDSDGNCTQISPHAPLPASMDVYPELFNPIVFHSRNDISGDEVTINLSAMAKLIQDWAHQTGKLDSNKFIIQESTFAATEQWPADLPVPERIKRVRRLKGETP